MEYEKDLIAERTKAGLDRAKPEGKQIGRAAVEIDPKEIKWLQAEGVLYYRLQKSMD